MQKKICSKSLNAIYAINAINENAKNAKNYCNKWKVDKCKNSDKCGKFD